MRLFLLPISTRRSLLYCQRLKPQTLPGAKPSYVDRITNKASSKWLDWEKKDSGWQRKVTDYGNKLFQRLPYQEYGLKSIPPLTAAVIERGRRARRNEEAVDSSSVEKSALLEAAGENVDSENTVSIEYPAGLIEEAKVWEAAKKLGSDETQSFHMKWLLWSLVGMPLSAPFMVVPIVPNLPFFYLCYRAFSHWRARSGSQHLEFLMKEKLLTLRPSTQLRMAYADASLDASIKQIEIEKDAITSPYSNTNASIKRKDDEQMLLSKSSGKVIAKWLEVPGVNAEIDRAVWQVERSLRGRQELKEEKEELASATQKA